MNLLNEDARFGETPDNFDLLRTRLEAEMPRPAVVAVTSSTKDDGAGIVALGLARSLVSASYRTLFINVGGRHLGGTKPFENASFEDVARHVVEEPKTALSALSLVEPAFHRRSGQRDTQAALQILSSHFDFFVFDAEASIESAFGTAIINMADAVLVSIKKGRRQKKADARLASELNRPDVRFFGIVALDAEYIKANAANRLVSPSLNVEGRSGKALVIDKVYVGKQ